MESVELKLREVNNSKFVTTYTKNIVEMLDEPQMFLEVKDGQVSEDIIQLVESLGYQIVANKPMGDWNRLVVVKSNKMKELEEILKQEKKPKKGH